MATEPKRMRRGSVREVLDEPPPARGGLEEARKRMRRSSVREVTALLRLCPRFASVIRFFVGEIILFLV